MPRALLTTLTTYLHEHRRPLRAVVASLAGGYLLWIAGSYGYFRMFSMWAVYDDEGYIMQSVRSYLEGHRLYDEVYSQYGPSFFLLQHGIYTVLGLPLDHDIYRLVTLAAWLGTAAAAAGIVFRLTRSLVLSAIALVHVFVHLVSLISEPGHPETVLGLTFTLACLVVAGEQGAIVRRHAAWCGILAAFAVFAKVNVGTYLFLGLAIPLVCATSLGRFAGPAAIVVSAVVPLVVFGKHLGGRSANYAAVGALSAAAVACVCYRLYRPPLLKRGILFTFVVAFASTASLVLIAILVQGTSPRALVNGILLQPMQLADVFYMPVAISRPAAFISALGLLAAVALTSPRLASSDLGTPLVFSAKVAFACGTLYASGLGYLELMEYVTPFLWIAVVPATPGESSRALLGRGVLAATAVFQFLQAYPVGGTQVTFATVLMIPCALVCLHDALQILNSQAARPRVASVLLAATAVWALTFYRPIIGPEVRLYYEGAYRARHELRLPGASRIRLLSHEVQLLHWLAGTIKANCTAFVSVPGFNSLYPWTGLSPLTSMNAGTWMSLLPQEEQERIWRGIDGTQSPCAIFNHTIANNWLGRPVEGFPAHHQLMARFQSVAEVEGFHFMLPLAATRTDDAVMALVAGRQRFEPAHPYLPVVSTFLVNQARSTIRTWIRTTRPGAVLGCQSGQPDAGRPSRGGLLLYVGTTGTLYGQHPIAEPDGLSSQAVVNDGLWHHVAIVRDGDRQALYVDGVLSDSVDAAIKVGDPMECQAGIGFTTSWPHARLGWMGFRGDIDGLAVARRAWSPEEVGRDWVATRPRD